MLKSLTSVEVFLALLYFVLVLGLTVPYGFPLTFPFVLFYFMVFFVKWCLGGSVGLRVNCGFILFYLCILSYLYGMALSQGVVYEANTADLTNIATFLILPLMLGTLNANSFRRFVKIYHLLVIPLVCFIGIFSLGRLYLAVSGGGRYDTGNGYFWLTSALGPNHNMYSLGMFFGLYAAWASLWECKRAFIKAICFFTLIVCAGAIAFSGSRRGWLVLSAVVLYAVLSGIRVCLGSFMKFLGKFSLRWPIISSYFSIVIVVAAVCLGALSYKDKIVLEDLGKMGKLKVRFESLFSREARSDVAILDRSERWRFGGELIQKYSLSENIFGGGFGYLTSYGHRFPGLKGEDDPHNFFISAMLYSGVLGTFLVASLIIFTFYKLCINKKIYGSEFFLLFLTTLGFMSVGGNSLYSVKIFPVVILTILSLRHEKGDDGVWR